jgi:peptidoglycan/LPS O-acetylase OafA/YrhL
MFPELSRKTIPALDGLRAVAVGIVMLGHFGFDRVPASHGVVVFFVLSGFLITWLLLDETERTGGVSLRAFYRRRALRILPAFYGFLLFALALLAIAGRPICWPQVGFAVAYAANYYEGLLFEASRSNGVFAHLWSLAVEEQFYLAWPVAFLLVRRRPNLPVVALASTVAAVWAHRAALILFGGSTRYVYFAFDTRADHLLIGCLLALVLRRQLLARFWSAVTRSSWMPLVTLAFLTCSIAYGKRSATYGYAIGYALDPVLVAIAIVQIVALSSTPAWRWMDSRPLAWMGRLSYSLYLFQAVALGPYLLPGRPVWMRFLVGTSATFLLAAASHYAIERPFLRMKDRRTRPAPVVLHGEAA